MDDPTVTMRPDDSPTGPVGSTWGPFQLVRKVGRGAFGEVYQAYDPKLRRQVAVKLLLPRGSGTEAVEESLREARAMARVRHPNVVPVYGVDYYDGRAGFWTDFIQGRTLSAIIAADGPYGPREAAGIAIDVCRAAGAVHAAGLIHRDIKSGNVMRESGGRVLLMDFGLTRNPAEASGFGGTPAYMAPELFAGQPPSVASDLYAIGILLFHMLTGSYPAGAGSGGAVLDSRPDLPESLVLVVETATNPEPDKRYKTAGQMTVALTEAARLGAGLAPGTPKRHWDRRWLLLSGLAASGVIAAVAIPSLRKPAPADGIGAVDAGYQQAHDLLKHYYRPRALETAIPLLEKITARNPSFAPGFAALGRANLLQFRQLREPKYSEPAREASLRALSLQPDLASAHVTLGVLYTQTGKTDLATQELDEALRLDKYNAEAHAALGELYHGLGRTTEAQPLLEKAVTLDPDDWTLVHRLGLYFMETGKLAQSREQYLRASTMVPDNPRALNNLAIVSRMQGRSEEAKAAFRKAIALEPTFARHRNLGQVLVEEGNFVEARPHFERAIELQPGHYRAWGFLALARQYTGVGRDKVAEAYAKAISLSEDLRRQTPNDAYLLADVGGYYAALGAPGQSVPLLKKAAMLAPDKPEVLYEVAMGFESLRDRDQSLYWMGKAVSAGWAPAFLDRIPQLSAMRADPRYRASVHRRPQ